MRSILVYADRGAAMEARLATAMAIARASQGHVTVLVDTPVTRFIAMDPMGGSYLATDALKQALEEDDAQAAAIEQQLSRDDVPFDVIRTLSRMKKMARSLAPTFGRITWMPPAC